MAVIRTNRILKKQSISEEMNEVLEDMENEIYLCGFCDNFPGDNCYEKSQFASLECPFKKRFESGDMNYFSDSTKVGCNCFYD